MSRVLKNEYMTLGWHATSENHAAKLRPITWVSIYPSTRKQHANLIGITVAGVGVLYLTDTGACELIKGLFQELLARPITLAADEELHKIMMDVENAITQQGEEARQVVNAVKDATRQNTATDTAQDERGTLIRDGL